MGGYNLKYIDCILYLATQNKSSQVCCFESPNTGYNLYISDYIQIQDIIYIFQRLSFMTTLELLVYDAVLLGEPVDAVIALSHPPDGPADGVRLEASGHASGGLPM